MFDENGNYKDLESNKEGDRNTSRFTKIGDILHDYVDEDFEEQKKDNLNKNNSKDNNTKIVKKKKVNKFKIILLGESGVGKTSLINKYVFNKFESSPIITDPDNSDKSMKTIDIDDKNSVELSIYDTTNEKKMGKITKNYYKDAHGAIIVFDFGSKESLNKIKHWQKEINNNAPKDIVICILGNKSDLIVGKDINFEEAKALSEGNLCYEVSAKDGNNVSLAFEQLAFSIIKEQKRRKKEQDQVLRGADGRKSINLKDIKVKENKKKCC